MNVRELLLENFAVHALTSVRFPASGIVTLVGPNGGGKSSVVEAVSVACWGKSLRGASPWRPGWPGAARVRVSHPGVGVARRVADGRTTLDWANLDPDGTVVAGDSGAYDTTTKKQAALEGLIGPWDVWCRTCVFSAQDAAHFSSATDGERKRLLESLLGLDRFDSAAERCREALRAAAAARDAAARSLAVREAELRGAELAAERAARAQGAAEAGDGPPPPESADDPDQLRAQAASAEGQVAAAEADARAARKREQGALSGLAGKGADLRALRARLGLLSGRAECPTCEQPVPPDAVALIELAVAAEVSRMVAAEAEANREARAARADASELEAEARTLRLRASDLRQRAALALSARRERAERGARREAAVARAAAESREAQALLDSARAAKEAAAAAADAQAGEVDVLSAASDALGLRGVRAHVLGKSIAGLETAATVWLTRLSYDLMSIRLQPYTAKKDGGLSDAISVRAGRKSDPELRGYDSLSGGERRRADVAILLALSEVAAAARGAAPGTLFFDEVFDALDGDGVAAVSEALVDLARDRCVVVISHRPELVDALPAALRLRAEGGKVLPA